jgi:hypothetical protein
MLLRMLAFEAAIFCGAVVIVVVVMLLLPS